MATPENDAEAHRTDQRERTAARQVGEADRANQTALDSLSEFMRDMASARKLLARRASPSDAMVAARDSMKEPPS